MTVDLMFATCHITSMFSVFLLLYYAPPSDLTSSFCHSLNFLLIFLPAFTPTYIVHD